MRRFSDGRYRVLAAAVLGWLVLFSSAEAAKRGSSYRAALESITAHDLQQHVAYLTHEGLEGREAGSRGAYAAGQYLGAQLAALKIRPAGVDGTYFQTFAPHFRNVLGWIEGRDPQLKKEFILLGAHYDHVGYGTPRNSRGTIGQIHPGADDNASGTSGLVKLAGAFALLAPPTRRSVLFAFWDAEEKEMLGSKHWLAHPTVPRERLAVAFNLDMIGRLRDDRVLVYGSRTSSGFRRLVCLQNEPFGLKLDFSWKLQATGDHYPFLMAGVPDLMFHTDLHDDYHRSTDTAALINAAGMERVVRLVFAVAHELAEQDRTPAFRPAARHESDEAQQAAFAPSAPLADRFGATWDPQGVDGYGVRLTAVGIGTPAHKAGFQAGDWISEFAGRPITRGDDLTGAISGAASPTVAVVIRPGQVQRLELKVELAGAPLRLGITWRTDDAEPGVLILTQVVPGSPAARAGLRVGDRIYQLAGQDFADDKQFLEKVRTLPGPVRILVERDGKLYNADIHADAATPLRRAA